MKLFKSLRNCIIFFTVILIAAVSSDILYKSELKYRTQVIDLSGKLHKAEKVAAELIYDIESIDKISKETLESMKPKLEKKGVYVAAYEDGDLTFWSGNAFSLPGKITKDLEQSEFLFLQNRWLAKGIIERGPVTFFYLIDIYYEYNIRNDFINSGFAEYFSLPEGTSFSLSQEDDYPVYNGDGKYIFSVIFDRHGGFYTDFLAIAILFWILALFFGLFLLNKFVDRITKGNGGNKAILIVALSSFALYFLFLVFGKPDIINDLPVFSPYRYTGGRFLPTPGHLLLASSLFLNITIRFFHWYRGSFNSDNDGKGSLALSFWLLLAAVVFYSFNILLTSLISDSNISYDFHKILEIDQFSILSFLSAAMLPVSIVIFLTRVFIKYNSLKSSQILISTTLAITFIIFVYIVQGENPLFPLLAFVALVFLTWTFRNRKSVIVLSLVSLSLVISAFSAWSMTYKVWDSETEKLKVEAVKYGDISDPLAESLLIDQLSEFTSDTVLKSMMKLDYFLNQDVNDIYSYLDSSYFGGYWEQYDIFYTPCNYDSPLDFPSSNEEINCFEFFKDRIEEFGIPVADSTIYLMDVNTGRPYYLLNLFFEPEPGEQTGLFIELINRIEYALPGYPELLQNKRYLNKYQFQKHSFAKYIGDSLVLQAGGYPFDMELQHDSTELGETTFFTENDYECLVYRHSEKVSIVLARPSLRLQNVLINFTYIFVLFFVLFALVMMLVHPPDRISFSRLDFRQKLQLAFISLLLASVVAIGSVVISLSKEQYRSKHYDSISEKLSSVYIELDHKLSNEEILSQDWQQDSYVSLDALLVKFSNVFFTDINLYTTDGELLATSRREIFDRNLKGNRMDFRAYMELNHFGESRFIQDEKVGDLTYLSAYTPFNNYKNEVLAYLNLPYFAMQTRLSEEVSNLVITIINFSLILLVVAMGIAVFIAVRITAPLRMLGEGLASVTLEGESNKLIYKGHDEIGELVKQYNEMLGQLHDSALKLARSEREGAWRDMAKQIAHEIKNPLTPMKLNVQQLMKSWRDNPEDFQKRLERFTENTIENIDNLSSIATEFSHFARMPQANPKEIDLVSQINSAAELFKNIKNISLKLNCSGIKKANIFADKEQINSMLTNIIRNAVQSIPSNMDGKVEVGLKILDDKFVVTVSDNGVGIPEELGEKLFTPNFTTKSSGMGIGLALVKRIVESAYGKIWYKSVLKKGTTFFIEFPIISSVRN